MEKRWSKEKAWKWYNSRPWIRGCNFMGSDCANRIDQWQAEGFEEKLETAKRELALACETGFNSIRIIVEYFVWEQEHDGFMDRLERYIDAAAQNNISCMIVFGNDCMPPKEEHYSRLHLGEQKVDWGYHGGRKVSQHGTFQGPGYSLLDEPERAEKHYEFVREIVTKYKEDERVIIWDVFNEPGNCKRLSMSLPHMKKFVEIIREIDPIQPITAGIWSHGANIDKVHEIEKYAIEISDVISFHNYGSYAQNIEVIKKLKKLGRPMLNTEWLNRCAENNVEDMFPLFYLEKIGCYNWGFVAGKYQTYEPWNGIWDKYRENPEQVRGFDFTKWFHDLYRPSLNPYNPYEIEIIKHFCDLADEEFRAENE